MKPSLSLLFLGVLSLTAPAAAPAPWSATLGVGGLVAPGTWAPLRLSVPAPTGPWSLEVRSVSVSGRESEPVTSHHPAGGLVEMPLYLADATRSLNLKFLVGSLVKHELTLPLAGRLFPGHLLGASGLTPRSRAALAELLLPQEPVKVVVAPVETWPTSALSYGGLSALVVTDPGPVLSPVQRVALRAWIASGGRLVVVEPRSGPASLVAQVGGVPGWGLVATTPLLDRPADWQKLLNLLPYGQRRNLGTDFDPVGAGKPSGDSLTGPMTEGAFVLVVAWAAVVSLVLVLRRKRSLGPAVVAAFVGAAVVLGMGVSGQLDWDQGLAVHGRELVLPQDLGRFTSLEAIPSTNPSGPFGWPQASPWALARWKQTLSASPQLVKLSGADRVSLGSFLPALPAANRQPQYRVRWSGQGLRWEGREEGPAELEADGLWLTKMVASLPDTAWSVGLDGPTLWLRPEFPGGRP